MSWEKLADCAWPNGDNGTIWGESLLFKKNALLSAWQNLRSEKHPSRLYIHCGKAKIRHVHVALQRGGSSITLQKLRKRRPEKTPQALTILSMLIKFSSKGELFSQLT
ncbi:hypothetical protein POVWA2_016540 [Plasmodium ovale wallikeri]|uniref:Uncharacterized protein n=1 Tax=Plasmodium ovale wallikeri TaxID=864142 RepID=A0A1A8YQ79_PLAOA|nr:hypothetical protein POVWA2_016540 [Plasmodium ovale wallikeri]SBT56501.1 hypothetical protein POVWA1_076560 [Plasmodium ovale wallikeri]